MFAVNFVFMRRYTYIGIYSANRKFISEGPWFLICSTIGFTTEAKPFAFQGTVPKSFLTAAGLLQ